MDRWECPLRCYHSRVHDYYVSFTHSPPLALQRNQISSVPHDGSFREVITQSIKLEKL